MKSVAMEENKQEKELEELQRLQDGFAVKVNATLNNYLNLPVDKMNKKCDTLQHELEKIHEMQMNIFTRFRKNQLANENKYMSRLSKMKLSLFTMMDNNETAQNHFCAGELNFNNDVKDNNEMKMFYCEYGGIYQHLQELKVFKLSNISTKRDSLGYRKAKNYFTIDSNASVSSQILCAMIIYLSKLAYSKFLTFANLLKQVISLESQHMNTAALIKDLSGIGVAFFTDLFKNTFEREYAVDFFATLKHDKMMTLWLMFGIHSVDIISGKLKSSDLFVYLKLLSNQIHTSAPHYLITRLAIFLTVNIISNFERIEDDMKQLDYVLTKQIFQDSDSLVVQLFENESKPSRVAGIKFVTKLIHSCILCCYKPSPPKGDNLEHNIIRTIKFFVPLLSKMTSAYYNCIEYGSICPPSIDINVDTCGKQLQLRYQTLLEQVVVYFRKVESGGWLHYAVKFFLTDLIEYLVKELQFDLDFVTSIEIDGKIVSSTPRDKVRGSNEPFRQYLRRLSLDIPSPFEKTTINQAYFQVLEHNAIVQIQLAQYDSARKIETPIGEQKLKNVFNNDEQKTSESAMNLLLNSVIKTLKQNEAVSAVQLSLVTRYYGKYDKQKARTVIDAFVEQVEKFIDGKQKDRPLEKERTKRYYFNSVYLNENVEQILFKKEKKLIEDWKKTKMKQDKMGFWEKMQVDLDTEDDHNDTEKAHKRCNSEALAEMTQITVEDVILCRNWEQCEQKQKQAMMAIKTKNEKTKDYEKLINMTLELSPSLSEARQDSFSQGVLPTHDTAQWEKYLSKHSSYEYKIESGRTYAHDIVARGHLLNDTFQQQMKEIVAQYIPCGKFKPAPVKKVERVIEKSETKYKRNSFPTAAHVLDIIRCSILFTNISDLLFGIEKFRELVKLGACGGITSIIRDKNDYSKMKNWKRFEDAEVYADWKSNALFIHGDIGMIVEIQFLQCEVAKKLGHSTYKINRRWPIGVEISFRLSRNVRPFYSEHYFTQLFRSKNFDALANALSATPFSILSIKNTWKKIFDIKYSPPNEFYGDGFSLFLDCILNVASKVDDGDKLLSNFFNNDDPLFMNTASAGLIYLYCWRIGCGDGGRSPLIERMINDTKIFDLYLRKKRETLIANVNEMDQFDCNWLKNIFKRYQQKQSSINIAT